MGQTDQLKEKGRKQIILTSNAITNNSHRIKINTLLDKGNKVRPWVSVEAAFEYLFSGNVSSLSLNPRAGTYMLRYLHAITQAADCIQSQPKETIIPLNINPYWHWMKSNTLLLLST